MAQTTELNQPILITGGTGFAGSHLIEALLQRGYTNLHVTSFSGGNTNPVSGVTIHSVNLTDKDQTVAVFEKVRPGHIYHLASFAAVGKSFEDAKNILDNNISLQLNVLDAVRTITPQARLLSIGSGEEYGLVQTTADQQDTFTVDESFPLRPANPYAVSKVTQDLLALSYFSAFKLDIVRVRPFNHIGEKQSIDFVIPAFAKQIVAIEQGQQQTIKVGNLTAVRDFTDVKDMVTAYIVLMEKGEAGEVYNVGSGEGRSVENMLKILTSLAHLDITIETDPSRLRPIDLPRVVANSTKVKSLGWQPEIAIETTLSRVLEYWRQQTNTA